MTEPDDIQALKRSLTEATDSVKDGNLDSAIDHLKSILETSPTHEVGLGMLASIYLQIGLFDDAIERFQQLLDAHPENPLGRFQLGMSYLTKGDLRLALKTWEPMLTDPEDFMAHFHSALVLLELNEPHRSYDLIQVAAKRMPTNHPLYPQLLDARSSLIQAVETPT